MRRRFLVVVAAVAWRRSLADGGAAVRAQDAGEHGNSVHNIGAGPAAEGMDLDAWCAAKNSDVGPAVSRRLTEQGLWATALPPLELEAVPGLSEGVPAFVVHGLLSREETRGLIDNFPSEGGAGYMPGERVAELYRDRKVKSRSLAHDEELARRLFERLKPHLPAELDGGRLLGINPNFRLVHYTTGGHHSTHIDGREPGVPKYHAEAGGWVQSRLTLQVYLNGDFEGGEFAIVSPEVNSSEGNVKHLVRPREGDGVVFYQERLTPPSAYPPYELQHEGRDVTKGQKFACRTMVDYVFHDKERATMGNVRDDSLRRKAAAALSTPCEEYGRHRVLAVGNTIIDMVLTMPYIPVDDKLRVSSKKTYVGGQGANAAQAMAMLGLNVSFLTRVGDDADGDMARHRYAALGMDPGAVVVVPGATTSSAAVAVSTGADKHRISLIHDDEALHGERRRSDAVVAALVARLEAGDFAAVYSDGWQPDLALPVARAAAKLGLPVVVDVEEVTEETRALAELATALIANSPMVIALAGCSDEAACGGVEGAVRTLAAQRGGRIAVGTSGPKGSFGMDGRLGSSVLHVPAVLADVRDTTGAGDTYHAGFVDGLVRGLSLHDTMVFATHAAAAKCETPGSSVSPDSLKWAGVLNSACL